MRGAGVAVTFLFVLVATSAHAGQAATAAELLTLEQAIALAGQNNRLVKNSSLDVEKAVAQIEATKTRRLPAFSFARSTRHSIGEVALSKQIGRRGWPLLESRL